MPGHDWAGVRHPDRLRNHPRSAQRHQEQEALEAGALHVPYARLRHNYFCDLLFCSFFVKNTHHMTCMILQEHPSIRFYRLRYRLKSWVRTDRIYRSA